jgi:hypothetical protein
MERLRRIELPEITRVVGDKDRIAVAGDLDGEDLDDRDLRLAFRRKPGRALNPFPPR